MRFLYLWLLDPTETNPQDYKHAKEDKGFFHLSTCSASYLDFVAKKESFMLP